MYDKHTFSEYNKAMYLRRTFDWGSKKIFSFFINKGISIKITAIDGWIYKNKKPFESLISKIPKKSKNLTKEKAYVLGVLCGDWYIRIHKSGTGFLVGLDVCDENFAKEFSKCLSSIYNLKPSNKLYKSRPTNYCANPKPRYVINLTSKLVVLDLLRYSKSFKTKEWAIPKDIINAKLEEKSAFLRGLFDSEGTIRLRRNGFAYLQFCSGNNDSLFDVKNMLLNDFDINMGRDITEV